MVPGAGPPQEGGARAGDAAAQRPESPSRLHGHDDCLRPQRRSSAYFKERQSSRQESEPISPNATEAAVQTAMLGRLPYTVFRDAILTHPTMAEGLNSLFSAIPAAPR